jgi:hypothetical protein
MSTPLPGPTPLEGSPRPSPQTTKKFVPSLVAAGASTFRLLIRIRAGLSSTVPSGRIRTPQTLKAVGHTTRKVPLAWATAGRATIRAQGSRPLVSRMLVVSRRTPSLLRTRAA